MTADDIRNVIGDAFSGARQPRASEIVPDHGYVHLEGEEIRHAFGGKAWDELTVPFLTYHRQAVFFFTPQAWAYYLPAYMRAVVDHFDETDTMLNELLATVTPNRDAELDALRRERVGALNGQQRGALVKFVEWAAAEHPDDLDDEVRQKIVASLNRRGKPF
jgi:hypothetical protein